MIESYTGGCACGAVPAQVAPAALENALGRATLVRWSPCETWMPITRPSTALDFESSDF